MHVPRPKLAPRMSIQNLEQFLIQIEGIDRPLSGGVAVYGVAAAYALVPDYGWDRGPGPRTLWSTNVKGRKAIMSRQAPTGYAAIHEKEFWPIIQDELSKVKFDARSETEMRLRLEVAVDNASQRMAHIIAESAPVDSGDLKSGVQIIDSADSSLDLGDIAKAEGQANIFF
jgi:hypothetical protein